MSNDKRQAWRTVSGEVMATYADSPMGTTHAVEMAAELEAALVDQRDHGASVYEVAKRVRAVAKVLRGEGT